MMSEEKRFDIVGKEFVGYTEGDAYIIRDNSIVCEPHRWRQWSVWEDKEDVEDLCDLLNEQQSIIRRDEISINIMMSNMEKLEKENKQLKEENEQLRQFITKGRRLSVKELMENTNENELLKKKIMELEKENKELQTELDSFRPVIFHTMQRGTITLYTNTNL